VKSKKRQVSSTNGADLVQCTSVLRFLEILLPSFTLLVSASNTADLYAVVFKEGECWK